MKKRLLIATTVLAFVCSPLVGADAAKPAAAKSEEKHTELGDRMEKLNGAYRRLKRQVADATKNEGSLALVATIKKEAEASLAFKPEFTAEQPAANQAKFVESYKTEMKKMIEFVGKLEVALKAGKNDEAAKVIADLDAQQKSSHKEFRKPKPKQ
jgi:cytochrome c556